MSEKPSTRLAQSVITKLSSHSVIEPNTYELDAVERRMIIWALRCRGGSGICSASRRYSC